MSYSLKYPTILISVLFATGIFFASIITFNLIIILLLTFIFSLIAILSLKIKNDNIKQITLILIPLLIGIIRFTIENNLMDRWDFGINYIKNAKIFGEVNEINLIKNNVIKVEIKTDSILINNIKYCKSINLLVNIKVDTTFNRQKVYDKFNINDKIIFTGRLLNPPEKRILGDISYRGTLKSRNIIGVAYANYDSSFSINKVSKFNIKNYITTLKEKLDINLSKIYEIKSYALLRGLILGDRGALDENIKDEFAKVGVAHVLAVSGLHVGLIVYILLLLFGRFKLTFRYLLTIIVLILYCYITGNSPSVVRATIMGVVFLLCKYLNRDYAGLNSLFLSLFIILLFNPGELFNVGLQLSFISVLTIILVGNAADNYLRKFNLNNTFKKILLLLLITLACQITTLPILLIYFHQISLIAIISNIFVIPLISLILIFGIVSLIISLFIIKLGVIFASGVQLLICFNNYLINLFANIKFSFVEFYGFTQYDGAFYYIIIIIGFFITKTVLSDRRKKYIIVLSFIFFCYFFVKFSFTNQKLTVVFIDVGQGDSFLIKTVNNKAILIDSGNKTDFYDAGEQAIIPTLKYLNINKLDYVFITHLDADHYMGLLSVIENVKIKELYKPRMDTAEIKDFEFEKMLKRKQIKINYYENKVLNVQDLKIFILNDTMNVSHNNNEKSGVLKIVFGKRSFLFMGDATRNMEKYYVNKYGNFLKSDVLKAGHHGSNSSSDSLFIEYVKPKYTIISCGTLNPYGFPNSKVLKRFDKKTKVLRTDLLGTIVFESDGVDLIVKDLNNKLKEY
ncbi:MAG TPA: DNA internalization-related competence protein ComEC/Rec2 [Melioribacteraceae bacterium]|nr:DNA internalization-related competence protein ComEC/Rec2 [Melioribacteraceae bacterium]